MPSDDPHIQSTENVPVPHDPPSLLLGAFPQVVPDSPEYRDLPAVLPRAGSPTPPKDKVPQPGFWWSLVWCVAVVSAMQTVGTLILIVPLFIGMAQYFQRHPPKANQSPKVALQESLEMTRELFDSDLVSTAALIAQGFAEITIILFALAALRAVVGPDWKRRLALRAPSAAHLLLLLAGFPALMFLNEGLGHLINYLIPSLKDMGIPFDLDELMETLARWPWWAALVVIAIGPGIGEELFCRGFLGQGLVRRYGWIVGILITSVLFGLIHMIPRQAVFAALMGVVLHFVYVTSRSLWLAMLLHFLNNSLAVLAISQTNDKRSRFPVFQEWLELPEQAPFLLYPAAAAVVAAVAWALFQSQTQLATAGGQRQGAWQADHPGVDYPPADSGTVVAFPGPDVISLSLVVSTLVFLGSACYAVLKY